MQRVYWVGTKPLTAKQTQCLVSLYGREGDDIEFIHEVLSLSGVGSFSGYVRNKDRFNGNILPIQIDGTRLPLVWTDSEISAPHVLWAVAGSSIHFGIFTKDDDEAFIAGGGGMVEIWSPDTD